MYKHMITEKNPQENPKPSLNLEINMSLANTGVPMGRNSCKLKGTVKGLCRGEGII